MEDSDVKKIADLVDERINKAVDPIKKDLKTVRETQQQQSESLINIESTIKVYGDMYKLNNDNMKKLEKRMETLEDNTGVEPPPELTLTEVQ